MKHIIRLTHPAAATVTMAHSDFGISAITQIFKLVPYLKNAQVSDEKTG